MTHNSDAQPGTDERRIEQTISRYKLDDVIYQLDYTNPPKTTSFFTLFHSFRGVEHQIVRYTRSVENQPR